MEELAKTIGIAVITNATVLGLFIWVFKKLFEASLTQRTKAFQAEIELLNKKNFHQYSKLYDEQAQNIGIVYSDLVKMADQASYLAYHYNLLEKHPELLEQYLIPKDGDPIKWDRYHNAVLTEKHEDIKAKELSEHASISLRQFREKRIYFKKEVAKKIEHYINLILYVASQFSNVTYRDPDEFNPVVASEVIDTWVKAVNISNSLFPALEETFRVHLGINDELA